MLDILFIDDDPDDYQLFCDAVKAVGAAGEVTCLHAKDGRHALQLLDRLRKLPDLVFLDINMPIMGGKECLKRIKASKKLKHVPVVMYSTTENEREVPEYYTLGASDFIIKPTSFNELKKVVKRLIETHVLDRDSG